MHRLIWLLMLLVLPLAAEDHLIDEPHSWRCIDIEANYQIELQANPVGGRDQGFANASQLIVGAKAHLGRGRSAFCSVTYNSGQNLSEKIQNAFNVATLFGGQTVFLTELWLQQELGCEDRLVRVGRLTAASDFATSPLLYYYVSLALNENPIALFFNVPFFPAYPFGAWGAYGQWAFGKGWQVRAGIYNGNSRAQENRFHGLNWTFEHPEGILLIGELDYHHRGGNYRFGTYYVTGDQLRFKGGTGRGDWGFYTVCDQELTDKVSVWAFGLVAPADRNVLPFCGGGGVVAQGLFKCRPDDATSLGVAFGGFSGDLRSVQRSEKVGRVVSLFGDRPQTYEGVVEINHWFWFREAFAVTPLVQWVINPNGERKYPDALVVGVQLTAKL